MIKLCFHAVLKSFFDLLQKYPFLKSAAVLFPHENVKPFFLLFCTPIKSVFCKLLYFTVKYCPICLLSFLFLLAFLLFLISFLFPWWKLNEASPSATVLTCMKLCPLLKAFLCCSTLWALSCLVFLLVILLALTDSQVNCTLRAACVLCVCLLHLLWRHFTSFRFWSRLFWGQNCII